MYLLYSEVSLFLLNKVAACFNLLHRIECLSVIQCMKSPFLFSNLPGSVNIQGVKTDMLAIPF